MDQRTKDRLSLVERQLVAARAVIETAFALLDDLLTEAGDAPEERSSPATAPGTAPRAEDGEGLDLPRVFRQRTRAAQGDAPVSLPPMDATGLTGGAAGPG